MTSDRNERITWVAPPKSWLPYLAGIILFPYLALLIALAVTDRWGLVVRGILVPLSLFGAALAIERRRLKRQA